MSDIATAEATTVTQIPEIFDEKGNLKSLKSKDFPRSKEGRIAFCEYRRQLYLAAAQEWEKRKEEFVRADDPVFQKQRKVEKLKAQLLKLEQELAAE